MTEINTFVIWKSGTTGLPAEEDNWTKLTRLSLLAVSVEELRKGADLRVKPLHFCIDPESGNSDFIEEDPTFDEIFDDLYKFLESLPKPVCLVAHNGEVFDFPILLAQCEEAEMDLPKDLLCVDSLDAFRDIVDSDSHSLVTMYENLTKQNVGTLDYISKSYMLLECIEVLARQVVGDNETLE